MTLINFKRSAQMNPEKAKSSIKNYLNDKKFRLTLINFKRSAQMNPK